MNILPKKRWHVRTKENMARVRRDEAKAAEEEKARADRVKLAEHEDRINRLKARAANECGPSPFDLRFCKASDDGNLTALLPSTSAVDSIEHVNLFKELEQQERQNLSEGNKEYETEKKKEYNDWESKMGIMKRFAEDTKEYAKEKNWWENIPMIRKSITDGLIGNHAKNIVSNEPAPKNVSQIAPIMKQRILEHVSESLPKNNATKSTEKLIKKSKNEKLKELEKKLKKKLNKAKRKKKEEKKKKKEKASEKRKKQNHKLSSSSDSSDIDVLSDSPEKNSIAKEVSCKKKPKIQKKNEDEKIKKLREERLRRERAEKDRTEALLNPKKEVVDKLICIVPGSLEDERKRKYNTQFNPEFTKR